jgi:long-chain acyl-CoA synthetase
VYAFVARAGDSHRGSTMHIKDFGKTALVHQGRSLSYGELIKGIASCAGTLAIEKGDRVALLSENRPEWVFALFGVWRKSGVVVPIDFLSKADEIAHILTDADPKVVFASRNCMDELARAVAVTDCKAEIRVLGETAVGPVSTEEGRGDAVKAEDLAVILYTSGTTGKPKGVMLTHGNLGSNIEGIERARIASEQDRILSILPFHHSYPLMVTVLLPYSIGATVIIADKLSSNEIIRLLKEQAVTIFVGVPRVFQILHGAITERIAASPVARLLFSVSKRVNSLAMGRVIFRQVHRTLGGNLRYFVSGGAKLDEKVAMDFWALGLPILEGYGLTETSPIIAFNPPDRIRIGSAGVPLGGVEVKTGEGGEILVRGPNVMQGYLHHEEKTREILTDGWLHTGDLGYRDGDYVYISGRKKDIIVLPNGKNINPEEMESHIAGISDFVKEVAVIEKEGQLFALIYPDFERLKAEKVTNIEDKFKWDVIDSHNTRVPDYKRIAGFRIVNTEFPKTRLGKIRRFLLGSYLSEAAKKTAGCVEPADEEYHILKEYLRGVTMRDVCPESHIEIDLGLDSLDKVELLSFIERVFGVVLEEDDLAELLLVSELFAHIKEEKTRIAEGETTWKEFLKEDSPLDISQGTALVTVLRSVLRPLFRLYFSLDVKGTQHIPISPCILAPNHQSYVDGFAILAAMPRNVLNISYFVANEYFFQSKLRRYVAREAHILTLDVNRNLRDALRKSAMLLKGGRIIVIFPEGARTRDGRLLPFKKSFAILSKELAVPVVPVAIEGAYEAYPVDRAFPRPGRIRVTFLPPLMPGGLTYEQIAEGTRAAVSKAIGAGD